MYDEIIQTLEFDRVIDVPPCIWGRRYTAKHRDIIVEFDFVIDYSVGQGLMRRITVVPDEYGWLTDHFDTAPYFPVVSSEALILCSAQVMGYYEALTLI